MNINYYPDEESVRTAIRAAEPLMMLVAFDGNSMIVSELDEGFEHHILLSKATGSDADLDRYFRIIADREGADWTFVCPPDYCSITRKDKRIERFFKDGMTVIPEALKAIGYDVPVNIPKRYRRHFDMMGD